MALHVMIRLRSTFFFVAQQVRALLLSRRANLHRRRDAAEILAQAEESTRD